MKIAAAALAIAALTFVSNSCAKHDWDETKVLQEGMGEHATVGANAVKPEAKPEAPKHE